MNLTMPCMGAHLALGEEVMVMDDAEVAVWRRSISSIAYPTERMGKHDE